MHERAIFDVLLERERLGTTGVGNGIAIPHGKLPNLDRLYGLFAKMDKPIDFDAIDEQPVDLIFLLLAPESAGADHQKALARVSRLLRDKSGCEKLRVTDSAEALYDILTESAASHAVLSDAVGARRPFDPLLMNADRFQFVLAHGGQREVAVGHHRQVLAVGGMDGIGVGAIDDDRLDVGDVLDAEGGEIGGRQVPRQRRA